MNSEIKRVLAVNDLSGYGRVSLTEALPILSAMGVEACPLPTAILSTHTYKFEDYTFLDMTDEMQKIIAHYKKLGLSFDAVSTGYMGDKRQIDIIYDYIKEQKADEGGCLAVIDPVLGDNALSNVQEVYSERMRELLVSMRHFVSIADIITPNLTEACLLLEREYPKGYIDEDEALGYLKALTGMGPKAAVITSIMTAEDKMAIGVYNSADGFFEMIDCGYVNRPFHGTGDIYTAALTGALVRGMSVKAASECAAKFVRLAIGETLKHPDMPIEKGTAFESVLAPFFSGVDFPVDKPENGNNGKAD